jgi:lysophospholipase L1-like esterase
MRLVTFGDSYTSGYGLSDSIEWKGCGSPNDFEDYYRRMNSWPRYVAEKLGIPFINMGKCNNFGNNDIYKLIKENMDELLSDDLIIIAFSFPYRNLTTPNNDYKAIDNLLKNYNRYYFNAFYPMFNDEEPIDLDFSRFIEPNYTFADYLRDSEKLTNVSYFENNAFYGYEGVKLGGLHPNLNGYKKISEFVYNKIEKYL